MQVKPIEDIDKVQQDDPYASAEYAKDIFDYMREREVAQRWVLVEGRFPDSQVQALEKGGGGETTPEVIWRMKLPLQTSPDLCFGFGVWNKLMPGVRFRSGGCG